MPLSLHDAAGIHYGFFDRPFRKVDMLDAPLLRGPLGRLGRRLRLKEWVGFGIGHRDLYGGILIQHAGYAASGTAYLVDRTTKQMYEWLVVDLPWRLTMPDTLYADETVARQGRDVMRFTHELDAARRHTMTIDVAATKAKPSLRVRLTLHQDMAKVDPLVVSLPIEPGHLTYTHKSPLTMEGEIVVGDKTYRCDPAHDFANLDEQKTYYPYRSRWFWGSFVTRTADGALVMTNFVDQMTPKDQPGEDAIWVDGKLEYVAAPAFLPQGSPGSYRLEDAAGRIKLAFTPEGAKSEVRNYGLVAMDYHQYYGRYDGTVTDAQGRAHTIRSAYGALERMSARF